MSKNLCSLACSQSNLAQCILQAPEHHRIRLFMDQRGFVNGDYLQTGRFDPFHGGHPGLESVTRFGDCQGLKHPILLLGAGLGYGLQYLLRDTRIPRILLYERDLYLLRIVLTLHDFAKEILMGRLVIVEQGCLSALREYHVTEIVPEPVLFRRNKVDHLTLSRVLRDGPHERKRAVFLSGAHLFTTECAATLFDLGWDVFEVDPTCLTADKTHDALNRLRPDLVLKINNLQGIEQFARHRKVVVWEIDPTASPIAKLSKNSAQQLFVFSHNPDRVEALKRSGRPQVSYLPLCADLSKFNASVRARRQDEAYRAEVTFVGSLMLTNHTRMLSALLRELARLAEVEGGGWLSLRHWVEDLTVGVPDIMAFSNIMRSLDTLLVSNSLPEALSINGKQILIKLPVAEWLSYHWRKEIIEAILPFKPELWGPDEWRMAFPKQYQGFADHYLELPRIYRGSKINLDIARLYQPNIVTMRIFDVLACGAFVLANRCDSLLELFTEDVEIVCYSTVEEAVDKIRYYLRRDDRRLTIASRGHEKVAQHHTFRQRIEHVLENIGLGSCAEPGVASVRGKLPLSQIL